VVVRVRLFAVMAQRAGAQEVAVDVPPGGTVAAAVDAVRRRFPGMPWPAGTMTAVNQDYAGPDRALADGDEVAVIPPVSGG
jgi:molybdopterin synthase catalytic subunit